MPKATPKDAMLLIELEKLKFTDPMEEAFAWFSRELADAPALSAAEFDSRYPKGSDGRRNIQRIGQYYETMGTIARYGLIDLDLLFDRYGVSMFWDKLSGKTEEDRKRHPEAGPILGENFEWLAAQNKAWVEKRIAKLKKRAK
ncbi:MAG TPA: hypothetical protein VLU99_07585 [Nitrososphaerales archaeon]|nr:hypothetical protein [Nitrososphaerales archaeon]HUK75638.1 hypothetical protein [Nitrososphaerales archaeon]